MLSLRERGNVVTGVASARRMADRRDRQDLDLVRPGFEFDKNTREKRFFEFACGSVDGRSSALAAPGYAAAFGAVWVDLPPGTFGAVPVYAARAGDGQIRKIRVTWDGTAHPEEELLGHVLAHALPIGHVRNRLAATITTSAAAARGKVRVPLGTAPSRWQVALKVRRGAVQQLVLDKSSAGA